MSPAPHIVQNNPFPGLRPFREDEEYLFFGRERQVDAMVDKLAATRFLAVVGTSGSGKSSLINCGLRPALHGGLMAHAGTAWRMAQFRPGSDPLGAMAHALAENGVLFRDYQTSGLTMNAIVDTTLRMSKLGLIDIYEQARLDKDTNLLVVVDQFEELFRYRQLGPGQDEKVSSTSEQATAFVNLLLAAKEQTTHPIYVVLTMRSDFLGDCTHFPGLAEAINAGQYLVPRLKRDQRRAAISGPISVGGAEIAPVFLTRLVNDVDDNPDQLSILQHALNRTWARWQNEGGGTGPLTLTHYEAIGTMAHALDQHAEKAYAELDNPRQQQICEKLFKALTDKATDPRGIRRPTTLGTLCALADATQAEVTAVIDVFRKPSRSFLMPPAGEVLEAETVIDISHETLLRVWERLNRWADEEARSSQTYRRLADTAALHAQGQWSLWRDPGLQQALDWRDHSQPNETWALRYHPGFAAAMGFLEKSHEARQAERAAERAALRRDRRRSRIITWGSVAAALIMSVFAAGMYAQWQDGLKAESLFLADLARQQIDKGDSVTGTLLALEALQDHNWSRPTQVLRPYVPAAQGALDAATLPGTWRDSVLLNGHTGQVHSAAFSPDGTRIVTASRDQTARLWNAADGNEIAKLKGHTGQVRSAVFSPNGTRIVTASDDQTARLWNAADGNEIAKLKGHTGQVHSAAFSPDGTRIVTASGDQTAWLWNAADGNEIAKLKGHTGQVHSAVFSPDGTRIVTASDDQTARLWNAADGNEIAKLKGHMSQVNSAAFSPDGTRIVTASGDQTARLWNAADGNEIAKLKGHTSWLTSAAFSPDGTRIVTGSGDQTARVWAAAAGTEIAVLAGHTGFVRSAVFSPDGTRIVTASRDETARVWDQATGKQIAALKVRSAAFNPDGTRIVIASGEGTAQVWEAGADGNWTKLPKELKGHKKWLTSAAFSPDGTRIVTASGDQTARVWDAADGTKIAVLDKGHTGFVRSAAFSPDGTRIVTASHDGTARVWDADDGTKIAVLAGHTGVVRSAAFSPDGTRIVTASDDQTARLWNAADGTKIAVFEGHTSQVNSAAFSPGGTRIVTASDDQTARLWNAADGTKIAVLAGHTGQMNSAAFSPDGKSILTADDMVGIWDAASGERIADFKSHRRELVSAAYSPLDGQRILTVSRDDPVRVWNVPPPTQERIEQNKKNVSRCLSSEQREKFHLASPVPRWCYPMGKWPGKWPYHDPTKTPIPPTWYVQPFVDVGAWISALFGKNILKG